VKDFGVMYFLRATSEKIGLPGVLRKTLPDQWEKLFVLACYLVASGKPVMYCEQWAESNDGHQVGSMSSQRISELLSSFGCGERNEFYRSWYNLIREREYIALDITSVSSYSEHIEACEWGYNRDGEDLPQVNICLLFGENTRLPVYQTVYSGSLHDVSTLNATINEFSALTGENDIMIVMDKGFFSAENIDMLLGEGSGERAYRFLVSVPFTSKFAKFQVESERKDIDGISNVIVTGGAPIRGVHKLSAWQGREIKLHAHVFFNPEKEVKERNDLFGRVASLKSNAQSDPDNKKLQPEYDKYLFIS
jgi:hypothetical protein